LKILLVRLRLIGDVVFTTPLVRALRRRFPDASLTYLVESGAAPVVAGNPHLDDVWVVEHRRGWRRVVDDLRLSDRARRARFDLAIDLHGGPRSAWLTWSTRAPVRVGYDVAGRTWMYTRVVPKPPDLAPRHSVLNQWDLLGALDADFGPADSALDRVEMPVDPEAERRVADRLTALGVGADEAVVVMHVSAGNPFRRWPETSFADVAAGLAEGTPGRHVVVTSGPSDRDAVSRVLARARAGAGAAASRIHDGEGLSLADIRALVERAALFIGGDSGPLHIAATSDVPVVGLYGPTLPERSAPWRPADVPTASVDAGDLACRPCAQRICTPGDFRCLTGISVTAVREASEQLLERGR
jgi:lipopolysaccharide heptosyltransferase II